VLRWPVDALRRDAGVAPFDRLADAADRRTGAQAAHHAPLCCRFSGPTVESPTARRLFYWYAKLKALEASFDGDPMDMLWLIQELKSSELNMPSATSAFH